MQPLSEEQELFGGFPYPQQGEQQCCKHCTAVRSLYFSLHGINSNLNSTNRWLSTFIRFVMNSAAALLKTAYLLLPTNITVVWNNILIFDRTSEKAIKSQRSKVLEKFKGIYSVSSDHS